MADDRKYRSDARTLKLLATGDLCLDLEGFDPADYFDDYDLWKRMSAKCDCLKCREDRDDLVFPMLFHGCKTCGNKRCPKARWHGLRCTNSNEPGQIGEIDISETTA